MRVTIVLVLAALGNVASFTPGPAQPLTAPSVRTPSKLAFKSEKAPGAQAVAVASVTYAPTAKEIRSLFGLWNDALATGDSAIVASRYAKDAVLLPTVSDIPRTNYASIKAYFDNFLLKRPQGEILKSYVKIGNGWAQDNGIYEFTMGVDGSKVRARYSYLYTREGGEWKIAHHHSSQMPEGIAVAHQIDEQEVRNLFHLWNDALGTLDPSSVANRYSKNAVLLPTVSDVPRDTKDKITDYFVGFLKMKPQGEILESFVQIGTNWCKDSGIYEFTMGATGAVVRARYSFIYVYEDGQWKISHHHSSQMPEEVEPKRETNTMSDQEVRGLFHLWNDALATGDPLQVAARYAKKSILLPTVSDEPRTTRESITDYFVSFLKKMPQGVITDGLVRSGDGWAKDAGVYEFTMGATGEKVLARYSFVYVFEDGEWKIAHHHSSVMPEGFMSASKNLEGEILSDEETRSLFGLWNEALATLDPSKVADRYARNAILLPTVSNEPRTTREGITDYFASFLKNKPQGTIRSGSTMSGPNWAEDAGVYDFTMGADGSSVVARYSFVYVKEDGEWKIAHHHSSAMPEGMMSAARKVKAMEAVLMS
jgi:uncharacterized protein (TIGR02246 family)